MTEVIYARVSSDLKSQVEAFAAESEVSLNAAVASLLKSGLRGPRLQKQMEKASLQLDDAQDRVREMEERESEIQRTYAVIGEKISQPVGKCPQCQVSVSGRDLLVSGQCQKGHPLAPLLSAGIGSKGLDRDQFLFLIGAIGLLIGIAALSGKS